MNCPNLVIDWQTLLFSSKSQIEKSCNCWLGPPMWAKLTLVREKKWLKSQKKKNERREKRLELYF